MKSRRASAVALIVLALALVANAQSPRRIAIAGQVRDEFGDPVIGAYVAVEGVPRSGSDYSPAAGDTTDDRGDYRISTTAGTYVVAVQTSGSAGVSVANAISRRPAAYKLYFPGVDDPARAERVTLRGGDERLGIDFVIPAAESMVQPFSVAAWGGANTISIAPGRSIPHGGDGIIRGRVTTTDRRPLPFAQVGLFLQIRGALSREITRADANGHFTFEELPPATYRVAASKAGYEPIVRAETNGNSLRILNAGRLVPVVSGQTSASIEVPLAPLATLSGRVLNDDDKPMQSVRVQLLEMRYEAGQRQLLPADTAEASTDDLGRFRLYGLAAGSYMISAAFPVGGADALGYTRTYYPAATSPERAQFVSVHPGETLGGVDISLLRGHTTRVAGRILDAGGGPTTGGSVMLRASQRTSLVGAPTGARLSPDGRFEFANVPPGTYVIQANRGRFNPSAEGEFGTLTLAVGDTEVTDLTLRMSKGSTVTGVFQFDTLAPLRRPSPSAIELSAVPTDYDLSPRNGHASAGIGDDWQFRMTGLHGPRRLLMKRAPAGWALKAILLDGIDVTDLVIPFGEERQSLEHVSVVLTDRVTELSGRVTNERAQAVGGAAVIAFAGDPDRWYPGSRFLAIVRVDDDGHYVLRGLPGGRYFVAAVPQPPRDESWQEREFLDSLRFGAADVTVFEGQPATANLRLGTR